MGHACRSRRATYDERGRVDLEVRAERYVHDLFRNAAPIDVRDDASGRVAVLSPVRLEQDAVDLLEVDGLGAVSDGLEQSAEAEVAHATKHASGGAHDEGERVRGELLMAELTSHRFPRLRS